MPKSKGSGIERGSTVIATLSGKDKKAFYTIYNRLMQYDTVSKANVRGIQFKTVVVKEQRVFRDQRLLRESLCFAR
jgi:hypothetical protein